MKGEIKLIEKDQIAGIVSKHTKRPIEILKGRSLDRGVSEHRHLLAVMLTRHTADSLVSIGKYMSDRKHCAIIYNVKRALALIDTSQIFNQLAFVVDSEIKNLPLPKNIIEPMPANDFIDEQKISDIVCHETNIPFETLLSKTRKGVIPIVRHLNHYMIKRHTTMNLGQIGLFMNGRDHTTILSSINSAIELIEKNQSFKELVDRIDKIIIASFPLHKFHNVTLDRKKVHKAILKREVKAKIIKLNNPEPETCIQYKPRPKAEYSNINWLERYEQYV